MTMVVSLSFALGRVGLDRWVGGSVVVEEEEEGGR